MPQACLGIDISKVKFHVALQAEEKRQNKPKIKVFPNNLGGFEQLQRWLQQQGVEQVHVCLEATSTYGEPVAEFLVEQGHTVSIVNPARIKGFAVSELSRSKTDKADAQLILRFLMALRPEPWQPPAPEVKQLQMLLRRLEALQQMIVQEQNRLETTTATLRQSIQSHIDYLQQDIEKIKQQIKDHFDQHPGLKQQRDLLVSIPGIGEQTAAAILSEIMHWSIFESPRQLAAYAGLTPRERSSGSSVRGKPGLSRVGNRRLRKALYMPAMAARRCNPLITPLCERLLEKGKAKKQVIGAAMRKLLHLVYGVLKSGQPFNPNFRAADA
ncbi:IS110 family transposase [Leptolyngbya sp. GGD]|uniref:IS110 family transposase n=1 Tax=Leptolyngbya sp. GGD TaxID=2997907 RepID=UPI00227D5C1E|nr:IS110 family transposase [Leptolyngbya sp. GGD]MCY6490282.1 IS110 family transposase [Leptolyngbya sp. GGD]